MLVRALQHGEIGVLGDRATRVAEVEKKSEQG